MEADWIKIYESSDEISVELLRQRLEEEGIHAVALSHRDSELGIGEVELYVHKSNRDAAMKHIA